MIEHKSAFRHMVYAWLVIFLCAMFMFYKYIMQISPSVMTSQIMQVFDVKGVGLGNITASFFYSYFITQLFVGLLLDRFGVRALCALAILICALGTFMFAGAHNMYSAGIARGFMGIGAAFATVGYLKCAAMWFPSRMFAFVSGLAATAAMIGAMLGEAPLALVVDNLGWRSALIWVGFIGVGLALLFFAVVREAGKAEEIDRKVTRQDIIGILKKPQNWILTFYYGLTFAPISVFGGLWGLPFIEEHYDFSRASAASMISLIFLGLAFGAPLLGLLSDWINRRRLILFLSGIVLLVCLMLVIYCPPLPTWLLAALLFSFGFSVGGFMLSFAMGKEINPVFLAGSVIALINSGDAVCGAFTDPLIGKLLDMGWDGQMKNGAPLFSSHDYQMSLSIIVGYVIVASILLLFVKDNRA